VQIVLSLIKNFSIFQFQNGGQEIRFLKFKMAAKLRRLISKWRQGEETRFPVSEVCVAGGGVLLLYFFYGCGRDHGNIRNLK
jgi:hypothetical protein